MKWIAASLLILVATAVAIAEDGKSSSPPGEAGTAQLAAIPKSTPRGEFCHIQLPVCMEVGDTDCYPANVLSHMFPVSDLPARFGWYASNAKCGLRRCWFNRILCECGPRQTNNWECDPATDNPPCPGPPPWRCPDGDC